MNVHYHPDPSSPKRPPRMDFFGMRWRREVALSRLFWRDMIVLGSLLNAATTVAALVLLGLKAPLWVAIVVHFLPLPFNLFLFASVWRTADRYDRSTALAAQVGATVWLVLATAT